MEAVRERLGMVRRRHAPRVAVEVLPARHVRRMRQHQADAQTERRLLACPAPDPDAVEAVDRGRGHVLVVHLVRRLAGPGVAQADPLRPGGPGQRAHVVRDPADVVGGVIADQPLDVAVELVGTDRVHAPDQHRTVPGRPHRVRDRRRVGGQHVVVRPHAVLMRVATGEHRHPRRHADRRGAVRRVEHRARRRQGVQMGRVDHGVAVAAGDERVVLVGVDVEQIRDRRPGAGDVVPDAAESAGFVASAARPTELRSQRRDWTKSGATGDGLGATLADARAHLKLPVLGCRPATPARLYSVVGTRSNAIWSRKQLAGMNGITVRSRRDRSLCPPPRLAPPA